MLSDRDLIVKERSRISLSRAPEDGEIGDLDLRSGTERFRYSSAIIVDFRKRPINIVHVVWFSVRWRRSAAARHWQHPCLRTEMQERMFESADLHQAATVQNFIV